MNYSDMTKDELLNEVDRLRFEKAKGWKRKAKGILYHLAFREGIFEREHPKEASETLGRPSRSPRMLGGVPTTNDVED